MTPLSVIFLSPHVHVPTKMWTYAEKQKVMVTFYSIQIFHLRAKGERACVEFISNTEKKMFYRQRH